MGTMVKFGLVVFLCFVILTPNSVAEFKPDKFAKEDEIYWKNKAEEAYKTTEEAYNPHPEAVTNYFNIRNVQQ